MKLSRRSFASLATLSACTVAASAFAQYAPHVRQRGDSGSQRSTRPDATRSSGLFDPVAAVEHELPSLRADLKLTANQTPLFDAFEREVREAAEAGRSRARHLASFRSGETATLTADAVIGTFVADDAQRADAVRLALERMTALYGALTLEQQKHFDRRIVESLREPLGTS
ncbi:MAG TPA: Spy/CpxP family protein refolding chaperone [Casimicrobiaceae bacterium]|nr:Spy/CpxP family protein refolding chaperone [Casimicrobiaceae bacterium]